MLGRHLNLVVLQWELIVEAIYYAFNLHCKNRVSIGLFKDYNHKNKMSLYPRLGHCLRQKYPSCGHVSCEIKAKL